MMNTHHVRILFCISAHFVLMRPLGSPWQQLDTGQNPRSALLSSLDRGYIKINKFTYSYTG